MSPPNPAGSAPRCRRQAGPGEGEPTRVLLLHGLGGRPAAWDRFVEQVTGPLELWDVELPWHGMAQSGWSQHGDQVPVLADLLAGGESGIRFDAVVAHSFAANLLTEAYATGRIEQRPSVLIGPCYRPRPEDFDWSTISYYLNDFHRTFVEALRVGETSRFPETHRDWMAMRQRDQVGPYGWVRFFDTYLRSPFLDLSTITVPVLVLTGDADIAAQPPDGRALAGALPDGRFVLLDNCGHFPMLEQPQRVARIVGAFLIDHGPPVATAPSPSSRTADNAWS